jgi:hypothetical protein
MQTSPYRRNPSRRDPGSLSRSNTLSHPQSLFNYPGSEINNVVDEPTSVVVDIMEVEEDDLEDDADDEEEKKSAAAITKCSCGSTHTRGIASL